MNIKTQNIQIYDIMSKIILEDFNGGDGYYKINLAYLNKDQIKEVEALVSKWNPVEETEDERIRKALIDFVKSKEEDGYMVINNFSTGSILAWLEKQREQINLPQFTFDDVLALQCCMDTSKKVQKDEELYHRLQSLHDRLHDAAYWLGKQGEQKPTEKLEPKFRVEDWLVENEPNNYARFIQILEVINVYGKERYKISRDLHNDEDVVECRFIENNYHSFTIQDAKDGDVLVTTFDEDNAIVMYHSMCTIDTINVHCCLDNKFVCRNLGIFDAEDVKPATKEQRAILFEKMHEAGYEWDTEKKELKKIEQKPKKVSIWKHWKDGIVGGEEGKQIYLIKSGFKYSISSCLGQECDYIELSELDKLMREQGKSKWSEDDEKMFNHIVGLLGNLPNLHNWLRSVKQRMKEC